MVRSVLQVGCVLAHVRRQDPRCAAMRDAAIPDVRFQSFHGFFLGSPLTMMGGHVRWSVFGRAKRFVEPSR